MQLEENNTGPGSDSPERAIDLVADEEKHQGRDGRGNQGPRTEQGSSDKKIAKISQSDLQMHFMSNVKQN